GAPGCVTWELILDGYSESSYSATPRFAAARLPWFIISNPYREHPLAFHRYHYPMNRNTPLHGGISD
ncbi:hypothetical protein ODT09_23325, partial [Escherichia coli]|nr:hypothetical protein [Escherichia coli]